MYIKIACLLLFLTSGLYVNGQNRVGINTLTPVRTLEVSGISTQLIRVHSTSAFGGESGLELIRGIGNDGAYDWKIQNASGALKILSSENNFNSNINEALRISPLQNLGIGTSIPASKLHIDGGTNLSFGGTGYLKLGTESNINLAFDNSQIQALNDGAPSPLYIQSNGASTFFSINGGNTYLNTGGGKTCIGTITDNAALNVNDNNFQYYIQNPSDGTNGWYIGASNDNWVAGGDQLLFSPSSSSNDAVLRLMNVTENDGTNAPVMIHTTDDQTILLDGNEIDTRNTPLYINHNSDENTLINPTGGMVGIGTSSPQATLHVKGSTGDILALQRSVYKWAITPIEYSTQNLAFYYNDQSPPDAQIHGGTGQWMHLSDRRLKKDIKPLAPVIDKVMQLGVYSYSLKIDSSQKKNVGIIAQEAEPLFPEMVYEQEGQYGVAYGQLAVVGVKAIQEQQKLIDLLKQKISAIKAQQIKPDTQSH